MLGHLYDRALGGERCWVRDEDGEVRPLPAHRWLGDRPGGEPFDEAVTQMCSAPTIELGCGPARLVARLIQRGDTRPWHRPVGDRDPIGRSRRRSGPARRCVRAAPWNGPLADGIAGRRQHRPRGRPATDSGSGCRIAVPRRMLCDRVRRRSHRHPCPLGASGVGWRRRAVVPLGIGRRGQRRHAGRSGRFDAHRCSPHRRPGDREFGFGVSDT